MLMTENSFPYKTLLQYSLYLQQSRILPKKKMTTALPTARVIVSTYSEILAKLRFNVITGYNASATIYATAAHKNGYYDNQQHLQTQTFLHFQNLFLKNLPPGPARFLIF
jgi:hypothetical protein